MKNKSAWQTAVECLRVAAVEEVPEGFKTMEQIGLEIGKSQSRTRHILREMIQAKLVEIKEFRVFKNGKLLPTPHYRLIEPNERTKSKRRSGAR